MTPSRGDGRYPGSICVYKRRRKTKCFVPTKSRRRALRRDRIVYATTSVLLATVLGALAYVFLPVALGPSVWRGSYYSNTNFSGPEVSTWVRQVMFYVSVPRPANVAATRFSATFASCLTLPEPEQVNFELGSDDGSRVMIDGIEALSNWGPHENIAVSGSKRIAAGQHLVLINYVQYEGRSSLFFKLQTAGRRMSATSPLLRAPAQGADGQPQCRR